MWLVRCGRLRFGPDGSVQRPKGAEPPAQPPAHQTGCLPAQPAATIRPTDLAHRQAAAELRVAAQHKPTTAVDAQVDRRPLSDYDRLFGLDAEVAA